MKITQQQLDTAIHKNSAARIASLMQELIRAESVNELLIAEVTALEALVADLTAANSTTKKATKQKSDF